MNKKRVVDAKADSEGDITHVKLEGNKSFTPIERAIEMTKRGEIDAVAVKGTKNRKAHLRSRPNKKKADNLDTLAGDK
ncbi:MAG: DUF3892 domain-containing protein [Acidobacteriota bacterium]|nr:MAG: DUF3892 domain-containing protein [Acidobacteriota bacterium]